MASIGSFDGMPAEIVQAILEMAGIKAELGLSNTCKELRKYRGRELARHTGYFSILPLEVIDEVAGYCSLRDIVAFSSTSRFLQHASATPLSDNFMAQVGSAWFMHGPFSQAVQLDGHVNLYGYSCPSVQREKLLAKLAFTTRNPLLRTAFENVTDLRLAGDFLQNSVLLGRIRLPAAKRFELGGQFAPLIV
jgi:hypothetical protein